MTDLEKELVEKLVDGTWHGYCDDDKADARREINEQVLPVIRSHTQALVAAAYAAAAKTCLGNVLSEEQMNGEPNLHVGEMCLRLCHERDAVAIRELTPADAARELERRELEARKREHIEQAKEVAAAIQSAVDEEREACAKVIERDKKTQGLARVHLAAAIRARAQAKEKP